MAHSPNLPGRLIIEPELHSKQRPASQINRRIQVTDGHFALVGKGFGSLTQSLPAGVYRIEVESRVKPFEETVFLRPGAERCVPYPVSGREELCSAAPIPGSEAMQAPIFNPFIRSWQHLQEHAKEGQSHVLLVVTADKSKQKFKLGLIRIRDSKGAVRGLIKKRARIDQEGQCATALVAIAPGGCVLEWPDPTRPGRRIRQSLWVPRNWCTVVFTGLNSTGGGLDPDKLSIYHWKPTANSSFLLDRQAERISNPEVADLVKSLQNTELAQQSLIARRQLLSFQEEHRNLMAKYDNPMLGILGCHMLLQRSKINHDLVREVIRNLDTEELVRGHPDVAALKILAHQKGVPVPQPEGPLSWPPMLRAGMAALMDFDWDVTSRPGPALIQPDTVCDSVRGRVFSGGLWTRWSGRRQRALPPEFATARESSEREASPEYAFSKVLLSSPGMAISDQGRHLLKNTALVNRIQHFLDQLDSSAPNLPESEIIESLRWTGLNRHQLSELLHSINELRHLHKWEELLEDDELSSLPVLDTGSSIILKSGPLQMKLGAEAKPLPQISIIENNFLLLPPPRESDHPPQTEPPAGGAQA